MNPRRVSQRPYFLRACYEWITASGMTPQIIVDADAEGVVAPPGYAQAGRLVLNLSADATNGLELGHDALVFDARFDGRPFRLRIPVAAVLGIYARESGEGIAFAEDEPPAPDGRASGTVPKTRLRIVK